MERRSPNTRMGKMPVAKIPAMRSPITKSPMPKSPFPMSPVAYDKYKSRCAYGLFSFFRFRHRHSKKMISDTHNHSFDDQPRNSLQYNQNKRGMGVEQQTKKNFTTAKVENEQSTYEHAQDQSGKNAAKTSRRPRRLPVYGRYNVSTAQQIVSERSQGTVEVHPESNCKTDCNAKSDEINLQVNLNEAINAFINHKSMDGRHISNDGSIHGSKQFLDALEVLNSNKDLFEKLLQDPNSLLVKDLRECQDKEQKKPLQKKTRLLENQVISHSVENIVIMKPRLNSLHHCKDANSPNSPQFQNMKHSVKPAISPFEQMKRKLMQAIRVRQKKQQLLLSGSGMHIESMKGNVEDMFSKNYPEIEAFDLRVLSTSSTNAKRENQMDEPKEPDPSVIDHERGLGSSCLSPSMHSKTEKHDLCVDPRIDISEARNGHKKFMRKQRVQRRFPPYGTLHIVSENYPCNQKDKKGSRSSPRQIVEASPYEKKPDARDSIYLGVSEHKSISSSNISSREIEKSISEDLERISSSQMTSKLDSSHDNGANPCNKTVDKSEERPRLPSLTMDASLETRAANLSEDLSSSRLNCCSGKQFDVAKDNTEQPSQFGCMLKYISRVIEASNFTWDELSNKCQSLDQIFDRSLLEDIDVGPTQCFHDHRLLIDYVNEVAQDAYGGYSRGSRWLSFIRRSIVPAISTNGNMVHEMMKCVDWELLLAQSGTLEKIVLTDLEKSRWMDIRSDAEDTVCEVVDFVLDELTTEVVIQ